MRSRSHRSIDAVAGRVSIVIPCFNAETYVEEAIRSALALDHPDVEVVVVDDGSRDRSRAIAESIPGITTIAVPNGGVSRARNIGIEAASGEFLICLDADDRLLPHAAAVGSAVLRREPDAVLCFGGLRLIDEAGELLRLAPQKERRFDLEAVVFGTIPYPTQSFMRRAIVLEAGGFRDGQAMCEDFDLYARMMEHGVGYCHGEIVADYRKHDAQASKHSAALLAAALDTVSRIEERSREDPGVAIDWARARRHWKVSLGRFLPFEIARRLRRGDWGAFASSSAALVRHMPYPMIGFAREIWGRATKRVADR